MWSSADSGCTEADKEASYDVQAPALEFPSAQSPRGTSNNVRYTARAGRNTVWVLFPFALWMPFALSIPKDGIEQDSYGKKYDKGKDTKEEEDVYHWLSECDGYRWNIKAMLSRGC